MIKIMCVMKVQGHIVGSTTIVFTSLTFHISRPAAILEIKLSNLTLKIQVNQGQNSWLHLKFSVQSMRLFFVSWQSDNFVIRYRKLDI